MCSCCTVYWMHNNYQVKKLKFTLQNPTACLQYNLTNFHVMTTFHHENHVIVWHAKTRHSLCANLTSKTILITPVSMPFWFRLLFRKIHIANCCYSSHSSHGATHWCDQPFYYGKVTMSTNMLLKTEKRLQHSKPTIAFTRKHEEINTAKINWSWLLGDKG